MLYPVYYSPMTNTITTANPAAIDLVQNMIDNNEARLTMAEQMLAGALSTLEQRVAAAKANLDQGLEIDSNWIREGAHAVEEWVGLRRAAYKERGVLAHVMKAAGGE